MPNFSPPDTSRAFSDAPAALAPKRKNSQIAQKGRTVDWEEPAESPSRHRTACVQYSHEERGNDNFVINAVHFRKTPPIKTKEDPRFREAPPLQNALRFSPYPNSSKLRDVESQQVRQRQRSPPQILIIGRPYRPRYSHCSMLPIPSAERESANSAIHQLCVRGVFAPCGQAPRRRGLRHEREVAAGHTRR